MHRPLRLLAALLPLAVLVTAPTGHAAPAPVRHAAAAESGRPQLPRGGRQLIGRFRIVAYYGGANGPALGILGSKSPEAIAADIERRAQQWRGYGRPVLPAMELIATVAQGAPGSDGTYSRAIPDSDVQRYLDVAHRHRFELILDFQPGRATFLQQVAHFRRFLLDPSVSVALDPEWKMTATQVPGQVIGHSFAHGINVVGSYLADLIAHNNLPDKLLVVHQFTTAMLPDRSRIRLQPGVEVTFHADGFGTQAAKRATWARLAFPGGRYGSGFKLFVRQDIGLMTPAQVMSLRPKVDLISYE